MGNTEDTSGGYDSTWEGEYDQKDTTEMIQLEDMKNHDVDCLQDDALLKLWFYQNKIPFDSEDTYIDDFHKKWSGDYDRLERVHNYIQWLFPTQEEGMDKSITLSLNAVKLFRRDEEVKKRLLTSYKLMLNFYGIELISEESGEVKRAANWRERFANLNRNTHNNFRITRILKCLGLLGFHHYQEPLVHFFLVETLVKGTLPQVKQSVLDYFIFVVVDRSKRKELIKFALCYYEPKETFKWCPRRIKIEFLKKVAHAQKETDRYQK